MIATGILPKDVPLMRQARDLFDRKASRPGADEIRRIWAQLASLQKQAAEDFPLSEDQCDELRRDIQRRVLEIHANEVAARDALMTAVA